MEHVALAARSLAEHLATIIGPTVRAILHYGSRAQGRACRPDSAFDFFIIVDGYRRAYEGLAPELGTWGRVRLAVLLAWVLPPSAVSVRRREPDGEREAKCVIISTRHFRRECARRARDHFVRARLSQHIAVAWSRDEQSTDEILGLLRELREHSFDWVRGFLPEWFDVAQYCRTLLAVSLAHEIRTEGANHAETLFAAQRNTLLDTYGPILARLEEEGLVKREGGLYRQCHPPGAIARWRIHAWFRRSKVRTTLRLLKHPFLYDGWLDYLVRKIDRNTGQKIELTERERRWPLIFLWPRAIRYLRTRPQHRH